MKVIPLRNIISKNRGVLPAGKEVDIPDKLVKDWARAGLIDAGKKKDKETADSKVDKETR